jgi:hypothetical protein
MTEDKVKVTATSQDKVNDTIVNKSAVDKNADLENEYTEEKKVVIAAIARVSAYRAINALAIGKPKTVIGSSITSTRKLMANKGELEAYYPELTGVSSNNPDFITRVKQYLSNIQINVDGEKELDCSFVYHHKKDYIEVSRLIAQAEEKYAKSAKTEKDATLRNDEINRIESNKYKYGYPINIAEYIAYRHCLLYGEVAKDLSFIGGNPNLRFYIKDIAKEKEREKKLLLARKTAMTNFIEANASPNKMLAVYVAYLSYKHCNVAVGLTNDTSVRESELINFINEDPNKFNSFVEDKNIQVKCFVELCIARGELVRSELNQQISTPDGQFIGENMNAAVAYFNNPNNAGFKTQLENKMKLI